MRIVRLSQDAGNNYLIIAWQSREPSAETLPFSGWRATPGWIKR